jgi:hypothetical protein
MNVVSYYCPTIGGYLSEKCAIIFAGIGKEFLGDNKQDFFCGQLYIKPA